MDDNQIADWLEKQKAGLFELTNCSFEYDENMRRLEDNARTSLKTAELYLKSIGRYPKTS